MTQPPYPQRVHLVEEVERTADEWEALAERTGATPFVRPGWISAWWRCFGAGRLEIVTARRGTRLVALAPVARRGGVVASPTNWHTPLYAPPFEDADAACRLADDLLDRAPLRLDLSFLPSRSDFLDQLADRARAAGGSILTRTVVRSPFVELDGDWEAFESRLPARRRSDLRRRRSRLEELGSVSLEEHDGRERLGELLDEGFSVEASGWKGQRGTAIASRPHTREFYGEVARWASGRGWLGLWFLRVDARAIAFAYCLVHGGSHYVLKIGFDPSFRRFGPGVLLTRAMLAAAFSRGLERYEFLGQADPYKGVWTERSSELARAQVFGPSLAGRINGLLWRRGRPLGKRALGIFHR